MEKYNIMHSGFRSATHIERTAQRRRQTSYLIAVVCIYWLLIQIISCSDAIETTELHRNDYNRLVILVFFELRLNKLAILVLTSLETVARFGAKTFFMKEKKT